MPIARFQMPDGRIARFEVPDGTSPEEAQRLIELELSGGAAQATRAPRTPAPESGVLASLKRGTEGLVSDTITAGSAAFGDTQEAARAGLERQQGIASRYADDIGLDKVKQAYQDQGLFAAAKEVGRQAPLAIAEQIPQLGATLAGAKLGAMAGTAVAPGPGTLIGGLAGAVAPNLLPMVGQNLTRQQQETPGDVSLGRAAAAGAVGASLETAAALVPFGRQAVGKLLGPQVEQLLARGGREAAERLARESLPRLLTKGTAIGAATQVPTEIVQQMLERAQAGLALMDDEALAEYGDVAYQAGLISPLGAAGRAADRSAARTQVQERQEEERRSAQQAAMAQAESARAEEEARRGSPDYLADLDARYKTFQQDFAQRQQALKELPAPKDDPAAQAAKRLAQQELRDFRADNAALVDEWAANRRAIAELRARPQAEDYALSVGLQGEGIQPSPRRPGRGALTAPAQDEAGSYVQERVEALQANVQFPEVVDYVEYLMADPEQARGVLAQRLPIPGLDRKQNTAAMSALKLQLQDYDARPAREAQALASEMASGREQAAAQRQRTEAEVAGIRRLAERGPQPLQTPEMRQALERQRAMEPAAPPRYRQQDIPAEPTVSEITDANVEQRLDALGRRDEEPRGLARDDAQRALQRLDEVSAELQQARLERTRYGQQRNVEAAESANQRVQALEQQLAQLRQEKDSPLGDIARARTDTEGKLDAFFDAVDDFRRQVTGDTAMLTKTRRELVRDIVRNAQGYAESAVREETARRRYAGQAPLTDEQAKALRREVSAVIEEVITRSQARRGEGTEDVVVQPAQMRGDKLVRGAVTERRDTRPLRERPFAQQALAMDALREQMETARARLSRQPAARRVTPERKPLFLTPSPRGEATPASSTLAGELRRSKEAVLDKLDRLPGRQERLRTAVEKYPTRDVLSAVDNIAERLLAGRAVDPQDRRALEDAVRAARDVQAEPQASLFEQDTTPQRKQVQATIAGNEARVKDLRGKRYDDMAEAVLAAEEAGRLERANQILQRRVDEMLEDARAMGKEATRLSSDVAFTRTTPERFANAPEVKAGRAAAEKARELAEEAALPSQAEQSVGTDLMARLEQVRNELDRRVANTPFASLKSFVGSLRELTPYKVDEKATGKIFTLADAQKIARMRDEMNVVHAGINKLVDAAANGLKSDETFKTLKQEQQGILKALRGEAPSVLKQARELVEVMRSEVASAQDAALKRIREQYAEQLSAADPAQLQQLNTALGKAEQKLLSIKGNRGRVQKKLKALQTQLKQRERQYARFSYKDYDLAKAAKHKALKDQLDAAQADVDKALQKVVAYDEAVAAAQEDIAAGQRALQEYQEATVKRADELLQSQETLSLLDKDQDVQRTQRALERAESNLYLQMTPMEAQISAVERSIRRDKLKAERTALAKALVDQRKAADDAARARREHEAAIARFTKALPARRIARDVGGNLDKLMGVQLRKSTNSLAANRDRAQALLDAREATKRAQKALLDARKTMDGATERTARSLLERAQRREAQALAASPVKSDDSAVRDYIQLTDRRLREAEQEYDQLYGALPREEQTPKARNPFLYKRPKPTAEAEAAEAAERQLKNARRRGALVVKVGERPSKARPAMRPSSLTAGEAARAGNADSVTLRPLLQLQQALERRSNLDEREAAAQARRTLAAGQGNKAEIARMDTVLAKINEAQRKTLAEIEQLRTRVPASVERRLTREAEGDEDVLLREQGEGGELTPAMARALERGDVQGAVQQIAESAQEPFARRVARAIAPLLADVEARIVTETAAQAPDAPGAVTADGTIVFINRNTGMSEDTLMHEAVHAATLRELSKPDTQLSDAQREAKRELASIHARVRSDDSITNTVAKDPDLREFVAEALASRTLQAALAKMPAPRQLTRWQQFKEAVLRLFGVKPPPTPNARDRVLELAEPFMRAPVRRTGTAPALLRARVDTGSAASRLGEALQAKEQPKGLFGFLKDKNASLAFEMAAVDMRAPVLQALSKSADTKAFEQAQYLIRKADARMAQTYAVLARGPLELTKDAAGYFKVEAGNGPSAKDLFTAISKVPGLSEQDKLLKTQAYLVAQRAANKGWDRLGFTVSEPLRKLAQEMQAEIAADAPLRDALEGVRRIYNAYNEGMIRFLADSGAITKRAAQDMLKDGDYVPFYRVQPNGVAELALAEGTTITLGDVRRQPYLKQLKGDEEANLLPLNEAVIRNTMLLTDMAMRNLATKSVAYALQDMGRNAGPVARNGQPTSVNVIKRGWTESGPDVIRFRQEPDPRINGDTGEREVRITTAGTAAEGIPSELVAQSLEGVHSVLPNTLLMQTMGWFGDILRAGITRSPVYVARQLIRDPMAAAFSAGIDRGPLRATLKAVGEFARQWGGSSPQAEAMIRKGVVQSGIFTGDPDDAAKFARQLASGEQGAISRLIRGADLAAMRADSAARVQVYEDTLKRTGSEMQAELAAMEVMNFTKRGSSAAVQAASRLIPFFNAQIQGLNVLFKSMRGNMPLNDKLRIREKFWRRAAMLMGTTMAYALMMQDNEEYKNARARDRYGNFFVPIPGSDVTLRIPIPYEVGLLFKALPEALVDGMAGRFNEEEMGAIRGMLTNAIPGGTSYGLPAAVKPLLEIGLNRSMFTGRPIESQSMEGLAKSERYTVSTTELAKRLSELMPQSVQLSPVQIEYLVRGYLGGLPVAGAALTNEIFEAAERADVERPAKRLAQQPVTGTLFQDRYGSGPVDAAYAKLTAIEETSRTMKKLLDEGRVASARAYMESNLDVLAAQEIGNAFQSRLKKLREMEKAVRAAPINAEMKRERLQRIDAARHQTSEHFLKAVRSIARAS